MFNSAKTLLILVIFFIIPTAWANDWECTVHDSENKQWIEKNIYERAATNKAYAACRKESRVPKTCTIAHDACEEFKQGVSMRPSWRCTALDGKATPWVSNTYPKRDDAANAAKAYCTEHSLEPESCYINLLTCVNLRLKS